MTEDQTIAENNTGNLCALFLQTRHGLLILSSVLFFIAFLYPVLISRPFSPGSFEFSLLIPGIYGYAMVMLEIIVRKVLRVTGSYDGGDASYNLFIFIVLTVFVLMGLYSAFGFDAVKEISLALVFLVTYRRIKFRYEWRKKSLEPASR